MEIKVSGCFSSLPLFEGNGCLPMPSREVCSNAVGFVQENILPLVSVFFAVIGLVI